MIQSIDSQIHELAQNIVLSCTQNNLLVTTVESCTGGMVAQEITGIAGSSAIFEFGFVTYCAKAKQELVNVLPLTIKSFGEVSENTCFEMAEGGLEKASADICVSVSGIAGPGGGTDEKPVGTVCFALATQDDILTNTQHFNGSRDDVRKQATLHALSMIFAQSNNMKR